MQPAVTSILWEFNYGASSGATRPAPHRLAPQQAINEYKEVLDAAWMYYVIVMDPALQIAANGASCRLIRTNWQIFISLFTFLFTEEAKNVHLFFSDVLFMLPHFSRFM